MHRDRKGSQGQSRKDRKDREQGHALRPVPVASLPCCRSLFMSPATPFTVRLPGPSCAVSRLHGLTLSILDRLAYGRVAHASWKRSVMVRD